VTPYEMEAVYFIVWLRILSVPNAVEAAKALLARDAASGWYNVEN